MKNVALLTVAALAGTAAAQTFNGAGFTIPDNNPAGNSSSIVIGSGGNVLDLTVTMLGATHTWVGDLTISLSNGSSTVNLAARPGFTGTGFGFSWNLAGDYTFADGAAQTWQSIGVQTTAFNLPSGTYAPAEALSTFNGGSLVGTWTLRIVDSAGGDTGGIQGWTLTNVPAPSALALLGLGGVVAGRRRR